MEEALCGLHLKLASSVCIRLSTGSPDVGSLAEILMVWCREGVHVPALTVLAASPWRGFEMSCWLPEQWLDLQYEVGIASIGLVL